MPLVVDLENNRKKLISVSSYILPGKTQWTGDYWQFSVDIDDFKRKLNTQADVADLDPSTKQSIFHYVLANSLFYYPQTHSKHYHISKKDMPDVLLSNNIEGRTCKDYQDNYTKLLSEGKLKIVEEVAKDYTNQMITALLKPYQNDDEALMRVLLTLDYLGNTPLFYAYKLDRMYDFRALFDRIGKLSPQHKEQLLFIQNENGRTILHALIKNYVSLDTFGIAYFGEKALRRAFWIKDFKGNTPLHEVFLDKKTYLKLVTSICKLTKSGPSEEKELPIETLFDQNTEGSNPLHLVCQRPPRSADDFQVFTELMTLIPEEIKISKLIETDKQDCTPLHYAIASGQFDMANYQLNYLNAQNQKIIGINPKALIIDYACQFGNFTTINRVFETLSSVDRYQIVSEFSELEKKMSSNSRIHQSQLPSLIKKLQELKGSNKLFRCFHYLEFNFSTNYKFTLRLNDFCNCWTEIETNISKGHIELPPEDPLFRTGMQAHKVLFFFFLCLLLGMIFTLNFRYFAAFPPG